jgi:hypothetical protein
MRMVLLIIVCLSLAITACRKKAVCRGNCVDIRISGRMYDAVTNTGFANQAILVQWKPVGSCWFCSTREITSGKTDNNGYFDFITTIDSSIFTTQYKLNVSAKVPSGYLDDYGLYSQAYLYNYSSNGLTNIQFPFYPAANNFSIKLHRTLSDTFANFWITGYYNNGHTRMGITTFNISSSQARDSTIKCGTAAGTYTYIIWRKTLSQGVFTEWKDSMICTAQGPNVFDINY